MSTHTQLSLVIPALNESAIIVKHVRELATWMQNNLPQIRYEIVVVNDGSTDGMDKLLADESTRMPQLHVLHHPTNWGRGRAIRTAMENTDSDYLIALDADLSYGPEHIKGLLAPLMNGTADLTLASPYHPEGKVVNVPGFRAWLSRTGNRVLSRSFQQRYYTTTCVVRGYTRRLIDHLELVSTSKELHLEVIYKTELLGFTIIEVPATLAWRDKQRGSAPSGIANKIRHHAIIKMRRAILSHFLFNFFSKPKLLFLGPILALLLSSLYGFGTLIHVFFNNLAANDSASIGSILRDTLIQGELTLTLTAISVILLLIFVMFLFLASQTKRSAEEQYILSARSNYRLKMLERAAARKN